MKEKIKRDLLRIVDANLNRSREGLRVCEEVVRFALEDARLTSEFKTLRHKISRSIKRFSGWSLAGGKQDDRVMKMWIHLTSWCTGRSKPRVGDRTARREKP